MMIGMAPADPPTAVPEAAPTPEIEGMHVGQLDGMEINWEEDNNHPMPITVWSELCKQDRLVGIHSDLCKIRHCGIPDYNRDASRHIPGKFRLFFVL